MAKISKEEFLQITAYRLEKMGVLNELSWQRYFKGKHGPYLSTLQTAASQLGVRVGDLTEWLVERREKEEQEA